MSTPHITIVTWYGLRDSIQRAADALTDLGYQVTEYPLFRYMCDVNDKTPTWKQDFIQHIKTTAPRVLLWWFFDVCPSDLSEIKAELSWCTHIMFNWDDPFKWHIQGDVQAGRSPHWDIVLTCCTESCKTYMDAGTPESYPLWPGATMATDKEWAESERRTLENDFECDVSFLATNLYRGDQYARQTYPRYKLVDLIAREPSIRFHLYGPPELKVLYPNHYKGFAQYADQAEIFRKSRITISTHVVGDTRGYINERVSLVMAAGAMLLIDPMEGVHETLDQARDDGTLDPSKQRCLVLDLDDPVASILDDLREMRENPQTFVDIKRRAMEWAQAHVSFQEWARQVHRRVGALMIDHVWVNKLEGMQLANYQEARDFWTDGGFRTDIIPYRLEIPEHFRDANVRDDFNLDQGLSKEATWVEYVRIGKPKPWLYCPVTGKDKKSEATSNQKLHPADVARIRNIIAEIGQSRPKDATLIPLLAELETAVDHAGGQHVDLNAFFE